MRRAPANLSLSIVGPSYLPTGKEKIYESHYCLAGAPNLFACRRKDFRESIFV
jgi:hypothetical protein